MDVLELIGFILLCISVLGIIYIRNLLEEQKIALDLTIRLLDEVLANGKEVLNRSLPLIEHKPADQSLAKNKRSEIASARMKAFWKKIKEDQK